MSKKITLISDTHSNHEYINLDAGDILVVAGDYSRRNTEKELIDFISWLKQQPVQNIILTSGNHDKYFYRYPERFQKLMNKAS